MRTYEGKTVLCLPPLEFEAGKIYAVIGANGSGKSTFARVLAGIIPADRKQEPVTEKMNIGYLPQKSYVFRMRTKDNVMLSSKRTEENAAEAKRLMEALKIDHLADKRGHRLSGGETARMIMARLLMKNYDVLILDEPTAAMDVETTALAENMLLRYREDTGCIMILVTHSLKQAERVADEVLFFTDGNLAESGPAAQVLYSPKNPITKRFLDFYGL
jgi:ABC-type multidrug transport system ATPase subunit